MAGLICGDLCQMLESPTPRVGELRFSSPRTAENRGSLMLVIVFAGSLALLALLLIEPVRQRLGRRRRRGWRNYYRN